MTVLRLKHSLVAVIAVLSLLVSAVSACACSHHDPAEAKVETSCHGTSHGKEADASQALAESFQFDTSCNCFTNAPVPAIVAKSDNKRTAFEKQSVVTVSLVLYFAGKDPILSISPASFAESQFLHSENLLTSLPARAPPRL